MNYNGEASGAKSCKDHQNLVQIGAPPVYWKSPAELKNGARHTGEFPEGCRGRIRPRGSKAGHSKLHGAIFFR